MLTGMQKVSLVALIAGVIMSFALTASGYFSPLPSSIVHTKNGPVQGFVAVSRDGRNYAAYTGIPFAEPPTAAEQLRFKPPVPKKSWNDVLKANQFGKDCYQFDSMVRGKFSGDEDCLYLNVYTPIINKTEKLLPVLVWIHGGGFVSGGSALYSPKYFMDHNVVVVSMNYRLGPLGFLNTGESIVSGNMGLKDQRLALRWVQDNIAEFGGNPNMVSLFGESAGAASVHSHIISRSSKDLFSRAIIQSGSIAAPWSLNNNPIRQAKEYGKKVGCPNSDMEEMVACLQQLSPRELTQPMVDLMDKSPFTHQDDVFSPSIEPETAHEPIFTENPRILLEQGKFNKVPIIIGVTNGEGGLRTSRIEANGVDLETIDKKWTDYAPLLFIYAPERKDVSNKIRQHYFSDQPFAHDSGAFLKNFTKMMSDGLFFHSLHKAAASHSQHAPVHLYFYEYESSLPGVYSILKSVKSDDWLLAEVKIGVSILKDFFRKLFNYPGPHEYGACHADDLVQLFKMDWKLEIGQKSGDYQFSKNLVKTFVDFASNVEPLKFKDTRWPVVEKAQTDPLILMKLDKDGGVIPEPFFQQLAFWDSLNIRNWKDKIDW
ncbi:venom carboxylesterase-6 isoform X2 [Folsomia candida]|uniref:venom carboxylesterase-6 isoform X2 n=1 Tax=Folsomia candida TaxID=158441 RepID=UPI000B8FBA6E|nr:venom carboxylesterase-6 isoform X2 [Folsomia candida]